MDPLAEQIGQALAAGWYLIPQVGHGCVDIGLWRAVDGYVDVVTLPELGSSVVVRIDGGPGQGLPRQTGHQRWRHLVPVEVAVAWLLTDPLDDHALQADDAL